jgi:predicted ester cyclase
MTTPSSSPGPPSPVTDDQKVSLAWRVFEVLSSGDLSVIDEFIHSEFVNHEASQEPPAARRRGPEGFRATALWLRTAFPDVAFELEEAIASGDKVVLRVTERGRHDGAFELFKPNTDRVEQVFPPTHRAFSSGQTHIFRLADGKVVEHRANRDDMGMAIQLGWIPPSPWYIARMLILSLRRRINPTR